MTFTIGILFIPGLKIKLLFGHLSTTFLLRKILFNFKLLIKGFVSELHKNQRVLLMSGFRIYLLLATALLAISTASIFARFIPDLSPIIIGLWRMFIASIILWSFSSAKPQGRLSRKNRILTSISGVFLGLHFAFFFGAVKYTSIANATLLSATAPVFTVLFELIVLRRKINYIIVLGLILAIVGTLIVGGVPSKVGSGDFTGRILALLAGGTIAVVYLLAEHIRRTSRTLPYTRFIYTSAGLTLALLALILGLPVSPVSSTNLIFLLMLGIIPTIIGHSSLYYAVKFTSPTIIASIPIGEPVVASILAWIILNENLFATTILGGVIILVGLVLISRKPFPPA
jgi:drug/metabolite transporter (DMT)-like permease